MKTIGYFGGILSTLTHKLMKKVIVLTSKDWNALLLSISKTYNLTELSMKNILKLGNKSRFTLILIQKT